MALRSLWHLAAVAAITTWALLAWAWPFPALVFGVGALIIAVLLWALFLSPKPALSRVDRFAQSMVELLLIMAAVAALLSLGVAWYFAVAYGLVGAVLGFIAGNPEK